MENLNKALQEFVSHCKVHPLYRDTILNNERLAVWYEQGSRDKPLFLGEAAGKNEAKVGEPFVGRCGKLLRGTLEKLGVESYAFTNVMPIKPVWSNGHIRPPTETEINFFRPYVWRVIKAMQPTYMVALGKTATKALELEWKPLTWEGDTFIMYHPAWYLRGNRNIYEDLKTGLEKRGFI